jgi:wyosine [tRNA(Phe)-imidazoG37] synthetase (radical SAM superfamily)
MYSRHPRAFAANRYIYPVLSRRSGGMSLGINLNSDKKCNFDCVYCQVERGAWLEPMPVDVDRLVRELEQTIDALLDGSVFAADTFVDVPEALRRLNDIAFSGDGEPTTCLQWVEVVQRVAEIKRSRDLKGVRLIAITNASMCHRPGVMRGLDLLMANDGEIWAKLDAGTSDYYQFINRSSIPFDQVLANLDILVRRHPVVIQSLFLRYDGAATPIAELEAYIDRLIHMLTTGGQIKLVQIYTIARPPAVRVVSALTDSELRAIANRVEQRTGLTTEAFGCG